VAKTATTIAVRQRRRLDHADLGEQRDVDDVRQSSIAERELVVTQPEQCLIGLRIVVGGDRREWRSLVIVERRQCGGPMAHTLTGLVEDEVCLDEVHRPLHARVRSVSRSTASRS